MSYALVRIIAYANNGLSLLNRYKTDLTAQGYDSTADQTAITAALAAIGATSEGRTGAAAAQVTESQSLTLAAHDAYITAQNTLQAASGRLGKQSAAAAEATRLHGTITAKSTADQIAAFLGLVVAWLQKYAADLTAKNFDPTSRITSLQTLATGLITERGAQMTDIASTGAAVDAMQTAAVSLYHLTDNALETAFGLLKGNAQFRVELIRMRAEVRGENNRAAVPKPATNPTTAPPAN